MAKKLKVKSKGVTPQVSTDKKKPEIDYPVFCFKYLQSDSYSECKDVKLIRSFFERCKKLAELGWKGIETSHKHSGGYEKLEKKVFRPKLPPFITPDVKKLLVFRYGKSNLPFVALRSENILHVIFIETVHGHIYDHD